MFQQTRHHRSNLTFGPLWIIAALLIAGSAHATGWGGYVGYGRSEGYVEIDTFFGTVDLDHNRDAVEFGFVLDTNLAQDRLFNYRLRVGLVAGDREYADGFDTVEEETFGVAIENTFGFGIVRTPTVRLWIGPSLRLEVDGCTDCDDFGYDSTFIGFGAGPEIGLNINIGDHFTIGPSVGYKYMYVANIDDSSGSDETFEGGQHQVSVLLNIFFRSGSDNFSGH